MPARGGGGHRRPGPRVDRGRRAAVARRSTTSSGASAAPATTSTPASGILILADVHGSSPFRACLAMVDGTRPVEIVAGVNLPMLIKLATCDRARAAPGRGRGAGQGGRQAVDPPRLGADRKVLDPPRRSPLMAHAERGGAGQEQAGHARACRGEVRADRQQLQVRGEGRQGRPGGERQEHHGPADAGGGARGDHDRRLRRGRRRGGGRRRWPSWWGRASGKGWIRDGEAGRAWARRPGSRSASRTCSRAGSRFTSAASPPSRSRPSCARFERALLETDAQLARIQAQIAEREGDEQQYRILEAHRLMLSDVHLVERARRMIRDDKAAAEWAVRKALDQIQAVFERIEDPVLPRSQERRRAGRRAPAAQPDRHRRLGVARGGAQGEHRRRARAVAGRRRPAGPRRGGRVLHRGRRPHLAHRDRGARAGPALRRRRRGAGTHGPGRG